MVAVWLQNRWKDGDWYYWPVGKITKQANKNSSFALLFCFLPFLFPEYLFQLSSTFSFSLHFLHLLILPYSCSARSSFPSSSSSSSLVLLLFLPSLPPSTSLSSPFRGSCSTCQTSPLVVSSHPTINSLFHSQGYDKVIMHGPCAAPAHTWTHTHTHPGPLALMEVDIAFPLKILWMSSIRESWQPGAPPINLSLRF